MIPCAVTVVKHLPTRDCLLLPFETFLSPSCQTQEFICTVLFFFHSFSSLVYFELMRVEQVFQNALKALGETACYRSVSTLDAAIIVFYIKKNCLHLIVRGVWLYILKCVRTP